MRGYELRSAKAQRAVHDARLRAFHASLADDLTAGLCIMLAAALYCAVAYGFLEIRLGRWGGLGLACLMLGFRAFAVFFSWSAVVLTGLPVLVYSGQAANAYFSISLALLMRPLQTPRVNVSPVSVLVSWSPYVCNEGLIEGRYGSQLRRCACVCARVPVLA